MAKRSRRALEGVIAADPGDTPALERLIHVAERAGQRERATELVKQQAEAAHRRARYEALYDRSQPIRDAVEMAALAHGLGRRFEARVFLTLALSAAPECATCGATWNGSTAVLRPS